MILTQEQEMIRDSMRAFAQERLAHCAADWDRDHTFPTQALKEHGELDIGKQVRLAGGERTVHEDRNDSPIVLGNGAQAFDHLLLIHRHSKRLRPHDSPAAGKR